MSKDVFVLTLAEKISTYPQAHARMHRDKSKEQYSIKNKQTAGVPAKFSHTYSLKCHIAASSPYTLQKLTQARQWKRRCDFYFVSFFVVST